MDKYDMLFIFIFGLVISCIIGFNTVNLIDKKISNISVNLPQMTIPKPHIILRIDNKDKNKIRIYGDDLDEYEESKEYFSNSAKPCKVACGNKHRKRIPNKCKCMDKFYENQFTYPIPIDLGGKLLGANYTDYQNKSEITKEMAQDLDIKTAPQASNMDLIEPTRDSE